MFFSTVQNILLRFGIHHELNFVFPPYGNLMREKDPTIPFRTQFLNHIEWHKDFMKKKKYDIFAMHTKWSQGEVSKVLGPKTVYLSILRDPSDSFESLYSYYLLDQVWFQKDMSIEHYLNK